MVWNILSCLSISILLIVEIWIAVLVSDRVIPQDMERFFNKTFGIDLFSVASCTIGVILITLTLYLIFY